MSQHRDFATGDILPAGFLDILQEYLGTGVFNFGLAKLTADPATAIKVTTGEGATPSTGNAQVSVAIMGQWRYRRTALSASVPGGLAVGTHDIYVTGAALVTASEDAGTFDYSFGLELKATGVLPSTAVYRKVGTFGWDGVQITGITQTIGIYTSAQGVAGGDLTGTFPNPTIGALPSGRVLTWGGDTNLKRLVADMLATDDGFTAALNIIARGGAAAQAALGNVGPAAEAAISFGSALDAVLYRAGAAHLRTPGDLTVDQVIRSGRIQAYAAAAISTSTEAGTNWLRAPKAAPSVFLGDNDSTASYAVTDISAAARFNGNGTAWGDLVYTPNAIDGHFKLLRSSNAMAATNPKADLGIGNLFLTGHIKRRVLAAFPTTSLVDGMTVLIQTAAMEAKGIVWEFRLRLFQSDGVTANPSIYKWEFVGGPDWLDKSDVDSNLINNGTTMADTLPVTLVFTPGFAAEWAVDFSGWSAPTVGTFTQDGVFLPMGSESYVRNDGVYNIFSSAWNPGVDSRDAAKTKLCRTTSGGSIRMQGSSFTSPYWVLSRPRWAIHPIRAT